MSNLPSTVTGTSFRDLSNAISPSWLQGPVAQAFRYSMSVMYDALGDGMGYALRAGLPHYAPADALPWFALDRQIAQGPNEPFAGFISRLIQWLDLYRHDGSSMAVMLAVRAYLTPLTPKMLTVTSSGQGVASKWLTYESTANPFPAGQTNPTPPDYYIATPANWDWDGSNPPFYYPYMHWREWLVVYSVSGSPWAAPSSTWSPATGAVTVSVVSDPVYGTVYSGSGGSGAAAGQFKWDDGTIWDWTGTAAQAAALTQFVAQWKSAGTWYPWIIVCYDATMFDEIQSFGSSKLPDATWGYWGKVVADVTVGTRYVASRPAATVCSFITGTNDGGGVLGVG
jgi:hypothetical protein